MSKNLQKMRENFEKKKLNALLNYNKNRHFELLNNLDDEFKEERDFYYVVLTDHLNWEIRDQYLKLLDNYVKKKIDTSNFRIAFSERYKPMEKVSDILISNRVFLSPAKNSLNFGNLLAKIDDCCEVYTTDTFGYKFEIGEVEFRILMEEIFLKIQNLLNEE